MQGVNTRIVVLTPAVAASSNGYPVKDAVMQKSPKSLNFGH